MAKKKPFSFAHLMGLGASDTEDEEGKKAQKAKGRRAEEDEHDDDAEEDEREEDADEDDRDNSAEDDEPEAEDDENDPDAGEDEDERKESKAVRQARISERKRCARIFGSKHAATNPALAASLAFNTGMSSDTAINVMASQSPASSSNRARSLDERMQASYQARLNPDGEKTTGKSALVSKMTGLYNSAKGGK